MKISIFDRPVTNTQSHETINWEQFCEIIADDPILLPNNEAKTKADLGDYYVRGFIAGEGRSDELLEECYLIILDIDKPIDAETPLPTPEDIHLAIGPTDVAYATHSSATPGRCRIIFPTLKYEPSEAHQKTWEAYCYCMELGLRFAFAGESKKKSQPWFFPQTTDPFNHQAYCNEEGSLFHSGLLTTPVPLQKDSTPSQPPPVGKTNGAKNQKWFIEQVQSGTLHQAAIGFAGFLAETTSWDPAQILDHITLLVDAHAADKLKKRWHKWERAGIEKWYRDQGFTSGHETAKEGAQIASSLIIEDREEILENEADDLSPFPSEILGLGAAGHYAETYSKYLECPPQYLFMAYLTLLGCTFSQQIRYNSVLSTEPRIYTCLIGDTAASRKSTAMKVTREVFIEALGAPFIFSTSLGSAEALHGIQKSMTTTQKATGEFDAESEPEPFNLLITFDEMQALIAKGSIKNSVLLPVLNQLYENSYADFPVAAGKREVKGVHLSIIGASTPDTYEMMYSGDAVNMGFPNRIFLVPGAGTRKFAIPPPMPKREKLRVMSRMKGLASSLQDSTEFTHTSTAYEVYNTWYQSLSKQKDANVARIDSTTHRLAMILALNKGTTRITEELFAQAIALGNWQIEIRKKLIYGTSGSSNSIVEAKILQVIKRPSSKKGMYFSEIWHKIKGEKYGHELVNKTLKTLKESDRIERKLTKRNKAIYLPK